MNCFVSSEWSSADRWDGNPLTTTDALCRAGNTPLSSRPPALSELPIASMLERNRSYAPVLSFRLPPNLSNSECIHQCRQDLCSDCVSRPPNLKGPCLTNCANACRNECADGPYCADCRSDMSSPTGFSEYCCSRSDPPNILSFVLAGVGGWQPGDWECYRRPCSPRTPPPTSEDCGDCIWDGRRWEYRRNCTDNWGRSYTKNCCFDEHCRPPVPTPPDFHPVCGPCACDPNYLRTLGRLCCDTSGGLCYIDTSGCPLYCGDNPDAPPGPPPGCTYVGDGCRVGQKIATYCCGRGVSRTIPYGDFGGCAGWFDGPPCIGF
jgi:hypothetical protein